MKYLLSLALGYLLCQAVLSDPVLSRDAPVDRRGQSGHGEEAGQTEGDIMLPEGTGKFSMAAHPFFKWPQGIVYYQLNNLESQNQQSILEAMEKIESELKNPDGSLCIEFKPKEAKMASYIDVVQLEEGCAAGIGRWQSPTPVLMSTECTVGIMMHELMHTIGLFHEQSRNDRDQYVTIDWNNVRPEATTNFAKGGDWIKDLSTRYDYNSIMHYRSIAFTKNGDPTILPKNGGAVIGQRDHLSECDVERVQVHYGCKPKVVLCAA